MNIFYIFSKNFLCYFKGASGKPVWLNITAINCTSALLTWQPPSNCSFTYTININNGSVVDYRSSDTTSLSVTHLKIGEEYSFAVAVEDVSSNRGPWSETTDIFWQGNV